MRHTSSTRTVTKGAGALLKAIVALSLIFPAAAQSVANEVSPQGGSAGQRALELKLVFTVALPARQGYAAVPRVAGHNLFLLTPFPHTVYAIETEGERAGAVRWKYSPEAKSAAAGLRNPEEASSGPAVADGTVFINTLDGHTLALDADTGQVRWDRKTAEFGTGETLTSTPLLVGDAVVIGNAGADFGARGWIKALDRNSGGERWTKYSTGPDKDVGIDSSFRAFYRQDNGSDLGIASWPPDGWQHGGGTVSGQLSYDPALDQVIAGTAHPAPGNPDQRPGDNKWTSGIFARDSATGNARWFTQLNPHDPYGFGATNANVLTDGFWHGSDRRLLIQANANGYVYVLDRSTGEILSAAPFAPVNAIERIDTATAEPRRSETKQPRGDNPVLDVCPAAPGAITGAPAYAQQSGLLFIPASFLCMDLRTQPASYMPRTAFSGVTRRLKPIPGQSRGALVAWDVEKAKAAWLIPEQFPLQGGVLATEHGLVFYGTLDGWLRAADQRSGRIVWEYKTKSQFAGQPTTYTGSDGGHYLAVVTGPAGSGGAAAHDEIDRRDLTAVNGFANALTDLPEPAEAGGRLYVFRLP